MTILLVLIPLGLALLVVAVAAFVWGVRNGQFDDLEGEGSRILYDDEHRKPKAATAPRLIPVPVPVPSSDLDREADT